MARVSVQPENPAANRVGVRSAREFVCPECELRCTRGLEGVEYGHSRWPRCSRRPDTVDPIKNEQ